MAESGELMQEETRTQESQASKREGESIPVPSIILGNKTVPRAVLYFFFFVVLFLGAAGPFQPQWVSGPGLHGILETLATTLAFVVGSLALVRFYSKKSGTFLYIGTGFLGTALLDTFHALVTSGVGRDLADPGLSDRSAWSFTASGTYLSTFLLVSWLAWLRERDEESGEEVRAAPVYLTAIFLAALIFVAFNVFPVTQAIYPEQRLEQPAELFSAFLFLIALTGYLRQGNWRFDAFEHWLVLSLLLGVMAHGAFMPFSGQLFDTHFVVAHVLKVMSYLCVLVGLMASVFITFRRAEEVSGETRDANSALAREINVRRQAQRNIQESEERLQDFLDNAHDLIQSVGPDGKFLYVNSAWQTVLGYSDEDLKERTLYDILAPSSREKCQKEFEAVLGGEVLSSLEVDFIASDGRLVRCVGSANARLQDGKAVATRAMFRDMTEQLAARRELEAFQANLQALVENTGDAIWSVNRSLRFVTFNTAFSMSTEARTGREPKVGDLPEDTLLPPEDAVWYKEMYQRALRGEAFSEMRDEEIAGQLRSFEFFFNPIREAMGITGAAVFGKDVTARRRTQLALRIAKEEAERANLAKSQFLANMSHELRTPLNSVIGFTNILHKNRSGHLVEKELGFLERISANGRHLLDLINEVLDLAKIEAGRMELDLQPTNLEELVKETLAQMEGQVKEKDVVLRGEIPKGLPLLDLDGGKLKQVIINLVGNALKFTEEGEVAVIVEADRSGGVLSSITIHDTGIGIPEDRLNAIFEAFQQADGTTSRRFGGTGLGLAISRSLCQLMGFDLIVESEVGKGSSFIILMSDALKPSKRPEEALMEEALEPIRSSKPRAGAEEDGSEGTEENQTPHSVLVIDDDPDSRVLMVDFLEDMGCEVTTAGSAVEGIQLARDNPPQLVTLDLMMPGVTGWEALKEFKADPVLRNIPVVIVSILAGESKRSRLLGAVDLLTKPVDKDELLRVLRRNLPDSRNKTVLVVDDDPDMRTLICGHLEGSGLKTAVAENGIDAEKKLGESNPAAIILDLVMPEMDGMTFLQRLRDKEEYLGLPVIICTGKELSFEERSRLQVQASGVVEKGEGFEDSLRNLLSSFFPLPPKQTGSGQS